MPIALSHPVIPGGLSEADHEVITALAEKGWSASRIARRISKHPSTVGWFMYRTGLRPPRQRETAYTFTRSGHLVRRFCAEEDALIQALRIQGRRYAEIASEVNGRFGFDRKPKAIRNRLVMLAGIEEAA